VTTTSGPDTPSNTIGIPCTSAMNRPTDSVDDDDSLHTSEDVGDNTASISSMNDDREMQNLEPMDFGTTTTGKCL